jgi:hypothetical protein
MRRKNDILWKVVIEEVFDDLLRFLYPDADRVYNLARGIEFLDKELAELHPEPEKDSDTRFVDKLVKVYHRNGKDEWVLLHVQIQGDTTKRAEFSARMFRYFYRILDRFRRPVSAVVIGEKGSGAGVVEEEGVACAKVISKGLFATESEGGF